MSQAVIPRGWVTARFGDIIEFSQNGCSARHGTGTPTVVLRLADVSIGGAIASDGLRSIPLIEQDRSKYALNPGDLLAFRVNGSPQITGQVIAYLGPDGYAFCDHFIRFRLRTSVNPNFAAYAFRTEPVRRQIVSGMVSTAGQNTVSQQTYADVRLPLAPVGEQLRIVGAIDSYFTRLDEAVATLERVQRNLKRYRASVLKAAVEGRLVPTEAELARAEKRDYEPASELLKRILVERRRRWEEAELAKMKASGKTPKDDKWKAKYEEPAPPDASKLPELPEGWCWVTVDQIGNVSGGLTQNAKRNALRIRLPFLRVANVYANQLRLHDVEQIGVEESEVPRALLKRGDLLVVEGNGSPDQIGRVALWDGSIAECLHQNHLIKVRFEPVSLATWVMTWLLSPDGRSQIQRVASSTSGLHTLSISKVSALPVPLCPLSEQDRIRVEADSALSLTAATERIVATDRRRASRLRQSILKWAFEGKLVDQDPNDEPASVLLDRIRAERAAPQSNTSAKKPRRTSRNA